MQNNEIFYQPCSGATNAKTLAIEYVEKTREIVHILDVHSHYFIIVPNKFDLHRQYYHGKDGQKMFFSVYKTIEPESNEHTLQKLANATKTFYECSGHGKAERNSNLIFEYKEKLKTTGIEIPSNTQLLEMGIFNGEGSS